jgi:simple sugar transport system permease protein
MAELPRLDWPLLAEIPVLGAVLAGKDVLTYAAWAGVAVLALWLVRTRGGLRLRATGAAEDAAHAAGVATRSLREWSTVLAGALAGLGGAHLALGQVGLFHEGMVAGRGFIAVAAMFFGRARPWSTAAACLLFAVFDATQIRLQGQGLPAELVQTFPYVMVIVVLASIGAVRTAKAYRRMD